MNITISDVFHNSTQFGDEFTKKCCCDEITHTWVVYGEDPNCDFGGSHVQPILGYMRGTFDAVAREALKHSNFVTWGSGGKLVAIEIKKIKA